MSGNTWWSGKVGAKLLSDLVIFLIISNKFVIIFNKFFWINFSSAKKIFNVFF